MAIDRPSRRRPLVGGYGHPESDILPRRRARTVRYRRSPSAHVKLVLHHPIGLQSLGTLFPQRDPMPPEAAPGNWHIDNIAPDGLPTAPADAREPIVTAAVPGRNHYHGTRTASVMISDNAGRIDGVAPGALVAPIRCVQDVVILAPEIDDDLLADAIVLAVDRGCQVISISLGGYPCSVVQ